MLQHGKDFFAILVEIAEILFAYKVVERVMLYIFTVIYIVMKINIY